MYHQSGLPRSNIPCRGFIVAHGQNEPDPVSSGPVHALDNLAYELDHAHLEEVVVEAAAVAVVDRPCPWKARK